MICFNRKSTSSTPVIELQMSKKKNGGQMATIQFENDEQRKNFQLKMALNVLEGEVIFILTSSLPLLQQPTFNVFHPKRN